MPAADERHRHRRDEELTLARRLVALHSKSPAWDHGQWRMTAFHHPADSTGCTLLAVESDFHIHIAEVSGLGTVAGVLAALCSLELLRDSKNLVEVNRHFLENPLSEQAMLAAGILEFHPTNATWSGSFAGLQAPIIVKASGRVELLRGTGPFLGLTDTTFPILRGSFEPGGRLFLLAGSGAGEKSSELLERLTNSPRDPVDRLSEELSAELEPGFGLTLLGVECNGHFPLSASATPVE